MRASVRLDEELQRKLREIQGATGWTTSEILRLALRSFTVPRPAPARSSYRALIESGWIGSVGGDPYDSTNYKQVVGEVIEAKFAHHE